MRRQHRENLAKRGGGIEKRDREAPFTAPSVGPLSLGVEGDPWREFYDRLSRRRWIDSIFHSISVCIRIRWVSAEFCALVDVEYPIVIGVFS